MGFTMDAGRRVELETILPSILEKEKNYRRNYAFKIRPFKMYRL